MGAPRDGSFPFKTSLSLDGLIGFWEGHRDDPASPLASQAAALLHRVAAVPELRGSITDLSVLGPHEDLLEELVSVLFPVADDIGVGAVGEPFRFAYVYQTPVAEAFGIFSEDRYMHGTAYDPELMARAHVIAAYEQILQKTYGMDAEFDYPLVVSITDAATHLLRHFQLSWDSTFFRVVPLGDLPRPTDAQLQELIGEPTNLDLWLETLPPDRFELSGLAIVRAEEVTMREALSRLKDHLLEHDAMKTPASIELLQQHIRAILRMPDIEVGLIGFDRADGIDAIDVAFPVGRSLLLSDGVAPDCAQKAHSNYAKAFESNMPVVVGDLEQSENLTGLEYHLVEKGLHSLMVQPLFFGDRLIGLLEVASPHKGALTAFSAFKLTDVGAPFATALQHNLDEREDRIQSLIKQQYTAIHPSVEWRFREAAARLMQQDQGDAGDAGDAGDEGAPVADQIVFTGVYPLYGLTDIRGSSDSRGRAIQADLMAQLNLALDIVEEAGKRPSFPVLDQIAYRIGQFLTRIDAGLHSEDETAASTFLARELVPILDHLANWDQDVAARVQAYRDEIDPDLGVLYRSRRLFDDSVMHFNEAVSRVLDREEESAQSVFPHFFEKFQTDGVDYNIYVGESLAEKGGFSPLYLHNLRLWQLKLVCRIEWELDRVRPNLGVELPPTHLILVQDQPLAIRFRTDEKRFDVDGAYNIRYELVKKRIDKARIRQTGERLTQPGSLAVVYSQAHEAQEYRRYLEYLTAAGYFAGDIEEHDLEDMQGVLGLRAFRVAINKDAAESLKEPQSSEPQSSEWESSEVLEEVEQTG